VAFSSRVPSAVASALFLLAGHTSGLVAQAAKPIPRSARVSAPPSAVPLSANALAGLRTVSGGLQSPADFAATVRLSWRDTLRVMAKTADSLAARAPEPLAMMGSPNAPLVVEIFEDYECPFCAQQEGISKEVVRVYAGRGLVRVIYYDFPLSQIHPFAVDGAMFAWCAKDQGAFDAARSILYARQPAWTQGADARPAFRTFAIALGLQPDSLMACYERGTHAAALQFGFSEAVRRTINKTPTFVVAGKVFPGGARTIADFQVVIEEALRGARPTGTATQAPTWKSGAMLRTGGVPQPSHFQ
jgi:protein-disulfide isomerase